MSEEFEVDTDELVEQLRRAPAADRDERGGVQRDDSHATSSQAGRRSRSGGVGRRRARGRGVGGTGRRTGKFTGTLRVITLGVEWPTPEVQKKAEADLGFKFALTVTDPVTMVQKAITAPETFDIFGGYNYQDIQMWSSHHLLPIDTHKITAWPQLYKLFAYGKVHPGSRRRDLRRRRRSVPCALPEAGHVAACR